MSCDVMSDFTDAPLRDVMARDRSDEAQTELPAPADFAVDSLRKRTEPSRASVFMPPGWNE